MAFSGIGNDKERIASSCLVFLPLAQSQKHEMKLVAGSSMEQGQSSTPCFVILWSSLPRDPGSVKTLLDAFMKEKLIRGF